MDKIKKFFLSIFGQDGARLISTKTALAYILIGATAFMWVFAFISQKSIPHIAELQALDTIVLLSYFGTAVAKAITSK